MKSSIRKARDDKDKSDSLEQAMANHPKQTLAEPKSPARKTSSKHRSSNQNASGQSTKDKASKHTDPSTGKIGDDSRTDRKNKSANEKRLNEADKKLSKQAK